MKIMGERSPESKKEIVKDEPVEKIIEVPINMELLNQKINQVTMMVNHLIIQNQMIMEKLGVNLKK
jgi:hypothetical protein